MSNANHADRDVPEEFRPCRIFGHAWDFTTVKRDGKSFVQGLQCLRCPTERHIKVNAMTGLPEGNKYDYPDGYLLKGGGGALSQQERGELRLSVVKVRYRPARVRTNNGATIKKARKPVNA